MRVVGILNSRDDNDAHIEVTMVYNLIVQQSLNNDGV